MARGDKNRNPFPSMDTVTGMMNSSVWTSACSPLCEWRNGTIVLVWLPHSNVVRNRFAPVLSMIMLILWTIGPGRFEWPALRMEALFKQFNDATRSAMRTHAKTNSRAECLIMIRDSSLNSMVRVNNDLQWTGLACTINHGHTEQTRITAPSWMDNGQPTANNWQWKMEIATLWRLETCIKSIHSTEKRPLKLHQASHKTVSPPWST